MLVNVMVRKVFVLLLMHNPLVVLLKMPKHVVNVQHLRGVLGVCRSTNVLMTVRLVSVKCAVGLLIMLVN